MKNKNGIFDQNYFISKGYTPDGKGGFNPPKFRNPLRDSPGITDGSFTLTMKDTDLGSPIILKQKINNTPDFEVKPVTEWFIKGNVPSKKNSRINFVRNGKQLSLPSKKHAEYLKSTQMQYQVFGIEFRKAVEQLGLSYPLIIQFTFVRGSQHDFDYCNACQTCEDIMKDDYKKGVLVKKGWIPDDSMKYLIPEFAPFEYDKSNPGVRIKLITNK